MDFPWRRVTALSAVTAYMVTTTLKPQWSSSAFIRYYALSYLLGFVAWAFWTVILYPKVFSPLRGVPEPKNLSWFNGQWQKIRDLPTGVPMLEWY